MTPSSLHAFVQLAQPDVLQLLVDADIPLDSAEKRQRKSIDRTKHFAQQQLQLHDNKNDDVNLSEHSNNNINKQQQKWGITDMFT